jgi:hypothetical protein
MSTHSKNIFTLLIVAVVGFLALRWALHLAISIIVGLISLAIVVGGVYVLYQVFGKKALGGGRRTLP